MFQKVDLEISTSSNQLLHICMYLCFLSLFVCVGVVNKRRPGRVAAFRSSRQGRDYLLISVNRELATLSPPPRHLFDVLTIMYRPHRTLQKLKIDSNCVTTTTTTSTTTNKHLKFFDIYIFLWNIFNCPSVERLNKHTYM